MYFATVDSATSCPSSASSDWILGAPQVAFSRDIFRMRWMSLKLIGGGLRLPPPVVSPALPMPSNHGLGTHGEYAVPPAFEQLPQQDPEDPIRILEVGTIDATFQNRELLTKREIFKNKLIAVAYKRAHDGKKLNEDRHPRGVYLGRSLRRSRTRCYCRNGRVAGPAAHGRSFR